MRIAAIRTSKTNTWLGADITIRGQVLARLEADLLRDTQAITYRIEFFNDVQAFCGDVLDWLGSNAPVNKDLLLASFYAAEVWPFLPNRSTFEDLNFTGNIRLLDDLELRTSLSRYYNRADTARDGWNPAEDYRAIIRGIIPNKVQDLIRQQCPTTDAMDERPTGFPECELPGVDYAELTPLFARLKDDPAFRQILTYRHSEIGVMTYLLAQQRKFGEQVLAAVTEC